MIYGFLIGFKVGCHVIVGRFSEMLSHVSSLCKNKAKFLKNNHPCCIVQWLCFVTRVRYSVNRLFRTSKYVTSTYKVCLKMYSFPSVCMSFDNANS